MMDFFFLLINMFANFISILFLFFSNSIFLSIFISYLFYLNPKLLRMEEEEIKGEESGRPQPVLLLTG